jgi:hypothetical protein
VGWFAVMRLERGGEVKVSKPTPGRQDGQADRMIVLGHKSSRPRDLSRKLYGQWRSSGVTEASTSQCNQGREMGVQTHCNSCARHRSTRTK